MWRMRNITEPRGRQALFASTPANEGRGWLEAGLGVGEEKRVTLVRHTISALLIKFEK